MLRDKYHLLTLPLAALFLGGCPDPNRPGASGPSVADIRKSEAVYVIEAKGHPLIVDWQPEHRGDLEVAMREGVAVVGYDANGLRLLKDCHIDGSYGFIGVNTKEQLIKLQSADEVKANLPAGGIGILASLGAELGKSSEIDIAIIMVGKKKTTWANASRKDLKGSCAGASHFVRGATIGAFALRSAAKGQARTAAEVFGAGVSASFKDSKQLQSIDGALEACRQASPDANGPPPQCGALLRLELVRLDEGASTKPAADKPAIEAKLTSEAEVCPQGFVFAEGKCTKPTADLPHACKLGDVRDCSVQCERGSMESCDTLGNMFVSGQGVSASATEAVKLFAKACQGGLGNGCYNLGVMLQNGNGVAKDEGKAVQLYAAACKDGVAMGCSNAGRSTLWGMGVNKDAALGVKLLELGCNGGDEHACSDLGVMMLGGIGGLTQDERKSVQLFKRACDGNVPTGCTNLAYMVEFGRGVQKNAALAAEIYSRACDAHPSACAVQGIALMYDLGGRKKDSKRSGAELLKACELSVKAGAASNSGELLACILRNELYGDKYKVDMQMADGAVQTWAETCKAGTARDCTGLGVVLWGVGKREEAKKLVKLGCSMGDAWGCELAKLGPLR